ncbi:MAG: MFS transporter [Candidatus Kariarchaeaceae archaeon]|jgi:MFS family permease
MDKSTPSLLDILRKKQLTYIVISVFLLDFTSGAFFIMGSIYLYERIEMSPDFIGYANAAATLSGTLLLLKFGSFSDKIGRRPFYRFGLFVYPAFFVGLSLFHQVTVVFILWCVPLYIFLRPTLSAMTADLTEENERSRGMSLMTVANTLSMTLGAIFGGYLADTLSYEMDIWTYVPAIFGWIGVVFGIVKVKESLPTLKSSARDIYPVVEYSKPDLVKHK